METIRRLRGREETEANSLRGAEAMPGLLRSRSLAERRLARSVAHRLKYYIDVQRKEDSFDSSGVISDVDEGLHSNLTSLTEREDSKEHNFAKIRLEASLRAYVGSAEECNRKVQKSPEKQKDMERLIKKMAQDYVPDRTKEGKAKSTERQRKLHKTATPSMSPEDVRRLVSSASKLIVAATSEVSPEELRTTQGKGSSPKRREAKSIRSLDKGRKKPCSSSTCSHKDEARAKQNQEGKNAKDIKKPTKTSNISSNSAKPKSCFAQPLPKPTDSSVHINSRALNLQTGQNEVIRKGILKSRASPSRTSSAITGPQDMPPSAQRNNFSLCQSDAESSARRSYQPLKTKKQTSSHKPAEMLSSKSCRPHKGLDARPILRSGNNQEVKENSTKHSTKSTAEVTGTQHSMGREKAKEQYNSTVISRGAILKGHYGHQMRDQGDQKSTFVGNIGRRRMQENEQVGCGSGSKRAPECHRVHFQKVPRGYIPAIVDRGCHCLESCSLHNLRGPEEATMSTATVDQPTGLAARVEEDYSDDRIPMVTRGSSFLYDVCQEMDQGAPAGLTRNRAVTLDGNGGDPSTCPLLNQRFSSNDPADSYAVKEPANSRQKQDILLGEPCDREVIYIPPMTPGGCRCSGLHNHGDRGSAEDQSSESSAVTPAPSERSESEQSEEEFTISSASGSSSARSLSSQHEQMSRNGKEEDSSSSGIEAVLQKALEVTPENSATWKEMFYQHSGKQRSPDEKRTDTDHGTKGTCTSQIVYFSHFPKSI